MYNINYSILIIILTLNLLLFIVLYKNIKVGIRKVYFIFTIIPLIFYSGIGLSYYGIDSSFVFRYLVYSSTIMIVMWIGFSFPIKKKNQMFFLNSNKHIKFLVVLFYLTYIVYLIYPTLRLHHIVFPPGPSVIGGYERIVFSQTDTILDIAQLFRIILLPVFFLDINNDINRKKYIFILKILLWIYLSYLSMFYIGRSELLIYLFLIIIMIFNFKNKDISISLKLLLYLFVTVVLISPFLLAYQYIRAEQYFSFNQISNSLLKLFFFETDFPKYYNFSEYVHQFYDTSNYILFFLALPIPSVFYPNKSTDIISINKLFSTKLLGVEYGGQGYSGMLPSIFGESLIVFGPEFFFIHAIIIAVLLVLICRFIEKFDSLKFFNLYLGISSLAIARGGSQGYFGTAINSIIVFSIIWSLLNIYYKQTRSLLIIRW